MALVLASTFTSGMVAGNGLVGRAFAEKMPGVTAPFGLFVRASPASPHSATPVHASPAL
tara:strand:- start:946 stop:1122 length:177 start_codon:yes stop_codon:yes gene_type:complete